MEGIILGTGYRTSIIVAAKMAKSSLGAPWMVPEPLVLRWQAVHNLTLEGDAVRYSPTVGAAYSHTDQAFTSRAAHPMDLTRNIPANARSIFLHERC